MRHKMFGGIHPAARKESTRRKALARMEKEPEWVILPLDQGGTKRIGARAFLGSSRAFSPKRG